ncbi:MAG: hypothetical protein KKC50_08150 [Candidatus Omnitrophica bacterium]|nr:hypothetical protein [Candidatus Omnitrophota bacterium]MBU1657394.1 hypothetical protein [Candidatus Omnitrophota bacterium]
MSEAERRAAHEWQRRAKKAEDEVLRTAAPARRYHKALAAIRHLTRLRRLGRQRRRLPNKRWGTTLQARVGGHKIYLRTGVHENGTLGEIFIDAYKQGAAFRCVMHCFAKMVSIALQYGVPLPVIIESFRHEKFEPCGDVTEHESITSATSLIDYIMQALEVEHGSR